MSQWTGVILAILLLALLSRLLVLPFSLKTERDQIRSQALSGELAALKRRLKDDPVRLRRAIRSFYKRNGLTPVFNLLALLFLPIMAIALLAVQELVLNTGGRVPVDPQYRATRPVVHSADYLRCAAGALRGPRFREVHPASHSGLGAGLSAPERHRAVVQRRSRHLPGCERGAAAGAARCGLRPITALGRLLATAR